MYSSVVIRLWSSAHGVMPRIAQLNYVSRYDLIKFNDAWKIRKLVHNNK